MVEQQRIFSSYIQGIDKVPYHYYTRFIGGKTELWMFGEGLGERNALLQIGDSFLQLVDNGEDPELGRVMFSLGISYSTENAYKGNFNVSWVWCADPDRICRDIQAKLIKPDLVICVFKPIRDAVTDRLGIPTMNLHAGVNSRFFKQLNLERKGIGFAGLDNKGEKQRKAILHPCMKRSDFEWISKQSPNIYYDTPEAYNQWLNTKQICLGMVEDERTTIDYIPTRVMESLASETPLIITPLPCVNRLLGIEYPFFSDSASVTEHHLDFIMDYANANMVSKIMSTCGKVVREKHDYTIKLRELFNRLKEMKK